MAMDSEQLNRAIDEVAREMTSGEPGPEFRARVMARIASGSGSGFGVRGSGFSFGAPLAGLAVAASIVIALLVFRHQSPPVDPGPATQAASKGAILQPIPASPSFAAPGAPAAPEETAVQPMAASGSLAAAALRGRPRATSPALVTGNAGSRASDLDALAPPPLAPSRLDIESIALGTLPLADSIQIDKLETITPIAVTPLSEGDRP